ncbi:cation/calcium exchanger 1 [Elaeis guineensis]|uniref:Cation/calcium exchanger 1 isoform X2 n=1 Tax=Elaeis guineensis var. tenera TaxID=51953 RepID=A0A6I9QZ38_ELAGV|nr:cation/calcium exchanger 1 isoform X2 [Elaeis guineensis]
MLSLHHDKNSLIPHNKNSNLPLLIHFPWQTVSLLHHKPRYESSEAKCTYLTSTARCDPQGYMNYLYFFYCVCGNYPALGYILLLMWLILLFYLLGNTAAHYFCSNLEGITRLLKLSPTIAGVTLLALGNGAPDIFSSIVSFMDPDTNVVGLNSILGAAFFVSCVVVGTISICVGRREIIIDKLSFIRDLGFLLFVLLVLLMIIIIGNINVFCALAFTSLYLVYVLVVSIGHFFWKEDEKKGLIDVCPPSCSAKAFSFQATEHGDLETSLLNSMAEMDESIEGRRADEPNSIKSYFKITSSTSSCFHKILYLLDLPLYLPRRLTIPDVSGQKWSKPYAVASAAFAPVLLTVIWNSKRKEKTTEERMVIYLFGGLIGMAFGTVALWKTKKDRPPTQFLCPWLAGGFLMSVVWVCIIAEELVSLLVSIGVVLEISPSLLGLSVPAWGNSLGDLVANVFVALQDEPGGAQVAISGSYGGPIFNILVGLGLSLLLSSWAAYPCPLVIPKDPTLFQTVGFLVGGLLWALLMLPCRGMKLDRVFGCGLLTIYLFFMSLRFAESLGLLQLQ